MHVWVAKGQVCVVAHMQVGHSRALSTLRLGRKETKLGFYLILVVVCVYAQLPPSAGLSGGWREVHCGCHKKMVDNVASVYTFAM